MDKKLKQKIDKYIIEQRKIQPEKYNQFELLDFLTNEEVDLMISISNRTDGKTYGYIKTLLKLNQKFDLTFFIVARHYTLRKAYLSAVFEIITHEEIFNMGEITFLSNDEFIEVVDKKGRTICGISDLNAATDIKSWATKLRDYDCIVYDEFIALEHEYLSHEIPSMKVIYETIDRPSQKRLLPIPKMLLLGNAINFSSPFISYYDLFHDIEKMDMNTLKVIPRTTSDGDVLKIAMELRRNEHANKSKNSRLFNLGGNNYAISGKFDTNDYLVCHDFPDETFIIFKYDEKYIKCYYNGKKCVLNVLDYSEHYDYCNRIKDIKKDVKFLNENYFDPEHIHKMYNTDIIMYANTFSLNYISDNPDLQLIVYEEIVSEIMYHPSHLQDMKKQKFTRQRHLAVLSTLYEGVEIY